MVHVLRNSNDIFYFGHLCSSRAISLISEQQEGMVPTVVLEKCTRISNMLSAFLGVKCLHTCNHFISTEQGAVGDSRGKRDL